jgi:hypothetical protein
MSMYRKKPVVIEARQLVGGLREAHELSEWCGGGISKDDRGPYIIIPTLEGAHRADVGDWIIRGVKGEFYPCKPDIFAATYDPA